MTTEIIKTDLTGAEIALMIDLADLDANFPGLYGHYVMPGEAVVALFDDTVATALCGFKWVPTRILDGNELPLCPKCKQVYQARGWT